MAKDIDKAKDNKATRVPGTLDKATGKRKKKKLEGVVQTGPRRLAPKKMVAKVEAVALEQEQVAQKVDWIWGSVAKKPAGEDVTLEQRDPTSAGHVIKEHRVLRVSSSLPTCSRHKKKKTRAINTCRNVKTTPSKQDNVTSDSTSTNTNDFMQNQGSSDQKTPNDSMSSINSKGEGQDDHKEQEQDKGACEDKEQEQNPDNTVARKQDEQKEMEEGRKKRLGNRLQKDLEKGLRMQKSLHIKLHRQLKSQNDLEMTKAILAELEKGLKLQMMVVNELRMRKEQERKHEHGLDESSLPKDKTCEHSNAARAPTLTVDVQAPAA